MPPGLSTRATSSQQVAIGMAAGDEIESLIGKGQTIVLRGHDMRTPPAKSS